MKYMGSKRAMLQNGLGKLLLEESKKAKRFIDLFCGSGYVSWFIAQNTKLPVVSIDLQTFAVSLATAVINRVVPLDNIHLSNTWLSKVDQKRKESPFWEEAYRLENGQFDIRYIVEYARDLCQQDLKIGPIWNAYGGYYFSPTQALTFDCMLSSLPENEQEKETCLAGIIRTASKCAASPGHTAQPFQPTVSAGSFIKSSWSIDPLFLCKKELAEICPCHANSKGRAFVADALHVATDFEESDLVFVDPPYSDVQYSRFYHVLETIARNEFVEVSGTGRYPSIMNRPQSGFSRRGNSLESLKILLDGLYTSKSKIIFTFPKGESSNGLSGMIIKNIAAEKFNVKEIVVDGKFSTLGGNNSKRASRMASHELILTLTPL